MLKSLLIANRGEIACRVIRTARRLGIRTVAVYSEADAGALHVRMADEAVAIGPAPARESYLVGEKIIVAAKETGAEAIHPGYGFLSENADFAQAVIDAGLIWVGPRPDSIRAMGLKDAAKQRMIAAGVPVTPGYLGEDQSPERLQAEADAIGYPVLIKAVAGGGGKGMRRVENAAGFADALASCRREAASSFGDDRVLIEKYILSPRHIEVQVFGDRHGNVVHLFERDCSLQRRHQKVIEEAPAPGMDAATREAVCGAAVRAAQAVDYVGAGTIEFIADASEGLRADRIWFMEMNTRLQVEHPVTEEITGQDLVEWQLRVASGEPLPKRQDELAIDGWAIEARLYAEDPAKGFLPSVGPLTHILLPTSWARVDTGVEQGDSISPFYDPMIAKLIVHQPTREKALNELSSAAGSTPVWPVKTNAGFLSRLCAHPEVIAAAIDTGFIAAHLDELLPPTEPSSSMLESAAAALTLRSLDGLSPHTIADHLSRDRRRKQSVWSDAIGFRGNAARSVEVRISGEGGSILVDLSQHLLDDGMHDLKNWVEFEGEWVLVGRHADVFAFSLARTEASDTLAAGDGALTSPMPGRIVSVEVAAGDTVTKGQRVVVIEAMKMEQALIAPFDGIVAEVGPAGGTQVSEGVLLARIEPSETPAA